MCNAFFAASLILLQGVLSGLKRELPSSTSVTAKAKLYERSSALLQLCSSSAELILLEAAWRGSIGSCQAARQRPQAHSDNASQLRTSGRAVA